MDPVRSPKLVQPFDRSEMLVRITVSIAVAAFVGAIGGGLAGDRVGAAMLLAGGAATSLLAWAVHHDRVALRQGAHLLTAIVFTLMATLCVVINGGPLAPILVSAAAFPMGLGYLLDRRETIAWTAAVALLILFLWAFDEALGPNRLEGPALPGLIALGELVALGIGLQISLGFNRLAEARARALVAESDRAERANRAKSVFLATMSHEIRTPMIAVLGAAELLEDEALSDEGRRSLALLRSSAAQLRGLVDDVLDLSRVESGAVTLQPEPLDVVAAVDEVFGLLAEAVPTRSTRLTRVGEDALWVEADPVRLRQILLNLVGNALKFSDGAPVEVTIRGGDGVHLAVRDQGPGIPRDKQAMVFEAFRQGDEGVARRHGGSGLGLAVVASLVRLMGGEIKLESDVGLGAVFSVQLPLPPAPAGFTNQQAAPDAPALEGAHVLVVDDNPSNRMILDAMLRRTGCSVTLADGGHAALEAIRRHGRFDWILMDLQMPQMDGFAVIRTLRSDGYDGPVHALSADAGPEARESALAAGADGYLSKPVSRRALEETYRARRGPAPRHRGSEPIAG